MPGKWQIKNEGKNLLVVTFYFVDMRGSGRVFCPNRQALDADPDPDPAKLCRSDRIWIRIHDNGF
jgi:hypothetical protein